MGSVVLYPFLLAVFPILSLYSDHIDETAMTDPVRPVLAVLVGTMAAWLGFLALTRNARKAGIMTALGVLMFWTYIPLREAVDSTPLAAAMPGARWMLPAAWVALFAALAALILRSGWADGRATTAALNAIGLTIVAVPVAVAGLHLLPLIVHHGSASGAGAPQPQPAAGATGAVAAAVPRDDARPDVYFIVLDAYGRADVLERVYGFAGGLAESLPELGFYIADESTANYNTTLQSIPSALNFDYIQQLVPNASSHRDARTLKRLVCDNAVRRTLRPLGYEFVAYDSGYYWTECPAADRYIAPPHGLSEFEVAVLNRSPLRLVAARLPALNPYRLHRERVLDFFESLPTIADDPAPTFVFAHMVTPHHPFVFGAGGEDVSPYEREFRFGDRGGATQDTARGQRSRHYIEHYRAQLSYVSKRLHAAVAEILRRSATPPIIVVQGDHGPNSMNGPLDEQERFPILNAYHLPDGGAEHLYASITPVNTFRVILDRYFGAHDDLLPDRSYRASYRDPFRFREVTLASD